ncbi:MAG: chromate transporter [Burkholderiaceae bacterium]|jgi:chromate transporter|nr:chromate transporter [Burkholderiaceae bacterium]
MLRSVDSVGGPAPHSLTDLFWSFSVLALQGFGGVMAVAHRVIVEQKRWLTREQFVEDWAVAQIMPGPNVVNISMMIGDRYFGLPGALTALAGMMAFPALIVLLLAALFATVAATPVAQGALRGLGAVAAGLIIATGLKLIAGLPVKLMGRALCVALVAGTFAVMVFGHWPLLWALLLFGGTGYAWAWVQLARQERRAAVVLVETAAADGSMQSGAADAEDVAAAYQPPPGADPTSNA